MILEFAVRGCWECRTKHSIGYFLKRSCYNYEGYPEGINKGDRQNPRLDFVAESRYEPSEPIHDVIFLLKVLALG